VLFRSNYNDDNVNTHTDFLIGKAVAMAISFGMIKNVKTIDITSNLVNDFQFSMITNIIDKMVSVILQ
jgi:galactokinase